MDQQYLGGFHFQLLEGLRRAQVLKRDIRRPFLFQPWNQRRQTVFLTKRRRANQIRRRRSTNKPKIRAQKVHRNSLNRNHQPRVPVQRSPQGTFLHSNDISWPTHTILTDVITVSRIDQPLPRSCPSQSSVSPAPMAKNHRDGLLPIRLLPQPQRTANNPIPHTLLSPREIKHFPTSRKVLLPVHRQAHPSRGPYPQEPL